MASDQLQLLLNRLIWICRGHGQRKLYREVPGHGAKVVQWRGQNDQWGCCIEKSRVGTNDGLAIALRIPGEAEARHVLIIVIGNCGRVRGESKREIEILHQVVEGSVADIGLGIDIAFPTEASA